MIGLQVDSRRRGRDVGHRGPGRSALVPGNLQTESYTRAMFLGRGSYPDHHDMEDTVRVRRDRQALLPNVDIQLIPFDTLSYEPLNYDFTVLRFDHDTAADIVYVEMYDDWVLSGQAGDGTSIRRAYGPLRGHGPRTGVGL